MSAIIKEVIASSLVAAVPGVDTLDQWGFEQLAVDPITPANGQIWFNTTEKRLKWQTDGKVQSFAHLNDFAGALKVRGAFTTAALPTAASDIKNPTIPLTSGNSFVYNGVADIVLAGIQGDDTLSTGDLLFLMDDTAPAIATSWIALQRNLSDASAVTVAPASNTYTDLPLGGTLISGDENRLKPGQSYTLPAGTAGMFLDVMVAAGTGVAGITATGLDKIKGLTATFNAQPKAQLRLVYDSVSLGWDVYGESVSTTNGGMEWSNWNTFSLSVNKARASGETFADFIKARIQNTVGLPVEAGLTADQVNLALGLGTVAPITGIISGQKPVFLRNTAGNTLYNGAQVVPIGTYAVAYNGTEIIFDQLEAAAAAAAALTPANYVGKQGQSQRVNAGETALEFFTSGGSVIGASNTFATLPTSNGSKAVITGDWAFLSAKDGTNEIGFYKYNGTAYVFGFAVTIPAATATSLVGLKGQSQRVNAAETALEFFTQNGSLLGSAATFATLPKVNGAKSAITGDWAYLSVATQGNGTVAAPQYPIGFYRYDGTDYQYSFTLGSPPAQQILDSWLSVAHVNLDSYGLTSFRQILFAISRTQFLIRAGDPAYDWNQTQNTFAGLVGFSSGGEHLNAPLGIVTGITGFSSRTGDATNGELFMFIASGSSTVLGFWARSLMSGSWGGWRRFTGDLWVDALTGPYQASSGAKVRIGDGVAITLNYAGTMDAIRLVPKTTWASVPTITATSGWTVSGQPRFGNEEVVALPDTTALTWETKRTTIIASEPALTAGEVVLPGDLRSVTINGVSCCLRWGGAQPRTVSTSALPVEIGAGWTLEYQAGAIPPFVAGNYYPIGFEVTAPNGYLKRLTDGVSIAADLANAVLWQPLGIVPAPATGATVTTPGTAGLFPAAPAGAIGDVYRRDGTYGPIPANGPMIGAYTPAVALPSGVGVTAGEYYFVLSDGIAGQPLPGVTLRNGDEIVAGVDNPTNAAQWYVRARSTAYQAGTADNVLAADAIEHAYTGAVLADAIRRAENRASAIALYSTAANMFYGSTVAGGARFAISGTTGRIYRAIVGTVTNNVDPAANAIEWEQLSDCHAFPFNATTLDIAALNLGAQSIVFVNSANGAAQTLNVKPNLTFGKTAIVDGVVATATLGVVSIPDVTSAIIYQDFTNPASTSGITRITTLGKAKTTAPRLANAEQINPGDLRSVLVGGITRSIIRYGGAAARTTEALATTTGLLTELNAGWSLVSQESTPAWAVNVTYPQGFKIFDGTKYYEALTSAVSAAGDLADAAKWKVLGDTLTYLTRSTIAASATAVLSNLFEYVGIAGAAGTATPKLPSALTTQQRIEFINTDGGAYTFGLEIATDTLNGFANGSIVSKTKGENLRFIRAAAGAWIETSAKSGFLTRGTVAAGSTATLINMYEYLGVAGAGVAAAPKLTTAIATATEQRIEFINTDGGIYTIGLLTATDTLNGTANGTVVSSRKSERLVFVGQLGAWHEVTKIPLNDASQTLAITANGAALTPAAVARPQSWTTVKLSVPNNQELLTVVATGGTSPIVNIVNARAGLVLVYVDNAAVNLTFTTQAITANLDATQNAKITWANASLDGAGGTNNSLVKSQSTGSAIDINSAASRITLAPGYQYKVEARVTKGEASNNWVDLKAQGNYGSGTIDIPNAQFYFGISGTNWPGGGGTSFYVTVPSTASAPYTIWLLRVGSAGNGNSSGEWTIEAIAKEAGTPLPSVQPVRAITNVDGSNVNGFISVAAYDNVPIQVQVTLAAGRAIQSAAITNGTVSVVNVIAGLLLVIPNGGNCAITIVDAAVANISSNWQRDVSSFCDNTWRTVLVAQEATSLFNVNASGELTFNRDAVIDASITNIVSEGAGLSLGYRVQVRGSANIWYNIDSLAVNNPATGVTPFGAKTSSLSIRSGQSLRFQSNFNDGGGNTYPGARTMRLFVREQQSTFVVPVGTTTRTSCIVTGIGANINGNVTAQLLGGTSGAITATVPLNQQLSTVNGSAGLVVAIENSVTGRISYALTDGTVAANLTMTFIPIPPIATTVNVTVDGVAANINGGATASISNGRTAEVLITIPPGRQLAAIPATGGAVTGITNPRSGAITLAIPAGVATCTITATTIASNARILFTSANSGVAITFGSIQLQLSLGSTHSVQIRSTTGNIAVRWHGYIAWDNSSRIQNTAVALGSAWTFLNASYNFTAESQCQFFVIEDTSNNRIYRGTMQIGPSYLNNSWILEEVL